MSEYYKRYIEIKIKKYMKSSGCVLVYGPKFCGKTTTCMLFQKSFIKLSSDSTIMAARLDPKSTLIGEKPRLIDEWQKSPDIWNYIKDDLDNDYQFGKYILTGSATPPDKARIHHGGTGRIFPIAMKPMSLFESLESKGTVSLKRLFEKEQIVFDQNDDYSLEKTAFLICRGGWPIVLKAESNATLDVVKGYYKTLFNFEESDSEEYKKKDTELLHMIVKSVARNISTEASYETIMNDVMSQGRKTLNFRTFLDYWEMLKNLFIIEDLNAWSPNIRSKTSIRSTPTRHFVDTSIACRALNISPDDLMRDMKTFGLFFEDFAIRDLSIYADALEGEIRHYRDNAGLECDAIIHLEDGRWGAVEIKLGGEKLIKEGISHLLTLRNRIKEKSREKEPSFLMVLTAVGQAYTTKEGVFVVPINLLRD